MPKRNINRETLLAVQLSRLRRHFVTCNVCRSADKAEDYSMLCDSSKAAIVEIARKWTVNLSARMRMAHDRNGWIYPCPDISLHGPAYSLAAEPCHVTDSQGSLI